MLPDGQVTEDAVNQVAGMLSPGDILIDGGNSNFKDDVRRAKALKTKGIHYVDIGTSGGVWGLERGFCMMVGGDKQAVDTLDPILKTLAAGAWAIFRAPTVPPGADPRAEMGYIHAGLPGAGQFRQDDPQRHRIRLDAGVRRRLRHS